MNYDFLQNKNILITGGTGSFGRELVREIIKYDPKVVRVFDVDETEQFEFHQELKGHEGTVRFLIGDVRDMERLIPCLGGCCPHIPHRCIEACDGRRVQSIRGGGL